jgi:hypothetical protein
MSFSRMIQFARRYFFTHPIYAIVFIAVYRFHNFTVKIHFYTEDEIRALVISGKSIIRYGDGEINIFLNLRNHYQEYSPILKKMLSTIVYQYQTNSPYILAVPSGIGMTNAKLKSINRFQVWLPFKVMYFLRFNKDTSYMDAHSFYYDQYFERVIAPVILHKKVVLVTKAETILFQRTNERFPWKDFLAVTTPEDDLLSNYKNVMIDIERTIKPYRPNDIILITAMGPVGKYIVQVFAERGYQLIDVGIGAETMFTDISIESVI